MARPPFPVKPSRMDRNISSRYRSGGSDQELSGDVARPSTISTSVHPKRTRESTPGGAWQWSLGRSLRSSYRSSTAAACPGRRSSERIPFLLCACAAPVCVGISAAAIKSRSRQEKCGRESG